MTMTSTTNLRRSSGKLVLLAALFVSLLHATSAAVKLGSQGSSTERSGSISRRALSRVLDDEYDALIAGTHTTDGYALYGYGARTSGRSKNGNGGKGGKGGSLSKVSQCYESCLTTGETPSPSLQPSPSPRENKSEKPECCKGGVSSLKMLYQGAPTGEIFLTADGQELVDACDKNNGRVEARKHDSNDGIVKFVSCSECFSDGTTIKDSCDFYSDSILVQSGEEVCLAVFDEEDNLLPASKMPTDLDLYFVEDDDTNEAIQTTLHTSCSKPIYSPFAVRLDDCETDGYPKFLDTTVIDIDSSDPHPVLVFIDGTSAKSPDALFTDCGGTKKYEKDDNACCKGGATFLKVRVGGTTIAGILTANETLAAADCVDEYDGADQSGGNKKSDKKGGNKDDKKSGHKSSSTSGGSTSSKGGKGSTIRFVSCEDECLDPFTYVECSESSDSAQVLPGEDICFGSWDEGTNRIDFSSKMATNLEMFFVPDDTDQFPVQSAYIHTSCSVPVHPNWATVFAEDCSSWDSTIVNLDDVSAGSLGFHVAFIDGVSRGYYEAAKELSDENGISFFNVNFADCGCNCDATAFPTSSPSTTFISPSPTSAPTEARRPGLSRPPVPLSGPAPPTNLPSESPSDSPTGPPQSCEEQCAAFVLANCVRKFDDGSPSPEACDVTAPDTDEEGEGGDGEGEGRFLRSTLQMLRDSDESDLHLLSVEDQIKYHDDMIKMYDYLLARLYSTDQ